MKQSLARVFGVAATLWLLAAGFAAGAEGAFDRTLQVSGPAEVEITTGSGAIHVRAGESGTVRIHGTIHASDRGSGPRVEQRVRQLEANPPIEQNGTIIRIGHLEDSELGRNVSISYDLVVPADTRLAARTGSGDQSAQGVRGPVKVSTGSGDVQLARIEGEVRATTGSGDIRLESIRGSVEATTGSGSILANGMAGEFSALTGSGEVRLQQAAAGPIKVQTGSGNIELSSVRGAVRAETGDGTIKAEGNLDGDWHLETGSGEIALRLPSSAGFELRAHTASGRISTGRTVAEGKLSRNDWEGKVGAGGHRLELRTGSGDIRIE